MAALPIDNSTAERLSQYIAGQLIESLEHSGPPGLARLRVGVEEMPGQAAWFETDHLMPDEAGNVVVLVLYDSQGLVAELAKSVVDGAASADGVVVWDRPLDIADKDELVKCDALILGSPNWTGMTGRLKHWWDYTGDLWETGELADKPAAAFSAGWSPVGRTRGDPAATGPPA